MQAYRTVVFVSTTISDCSFAVMWKQTISSLQIDISAKVLIIFFTFKICIYSDVRSNNLSGEIPPSIGNCTSFEILYAFVSCCYHAIYISICCDLGIIIIILWNLSLVYACCDQRFGLQPIQWWNPIQHWFSPDCYVVCWSYLKSYYIFIIVSLYEYHQF